MNNQFKVYHPADQTRHTVKARTVVRALVEVLVSQNKKSSGSIAKEVGLGNPEKNDAS
jgi:hypothetical protein